MMKNKIIQVLIACILVFLANSVWSENIDPYEDGSQYAYGENVGWLNFDPNTGDGVQVGSDVLTGWVWAENIGWISLSCENTASCPTVSYGVTNDGGGNLSGYAWAENVGWINFDPNVPGDDTKYGVTIDANGNFDGWAWGENIGWIHFQSASPVAYKVQACKVSFEDFANFALYWLDSGAGLPADLDNLGDVNIDDLNVFAIYWLGFCPDGWRLK